MTLAVEYGVPTDKCAVQLRLGIEKGFFRDEGLDLSLRIVYGGPEIALEYDSGELKIGEMGTPPCLTAIAKGYRFRIVGSGVRRQAVQFFVTRPDLTSWDDLRGRRLGALTLGSCSYWFLRQILGQHGLDPDKDVEIVGLGPRYPRIVELIADGEIDGAIIPEPNVTLAESSGIGRVWFGLPSVDFVPRMQWTVCVANLKTIEREPELIMAVLRGCRRSYRHAAANRDEWASFAARHFGIDRAIIDRSIAREVDFLHVDCEIDQPGLIEAIKMQQVLGSIPGTMTVEEVTELRFQYSLAGENPAAAQ